MLFQALKVYPEVGNWWNERSCVAYGSLQPSRISFKGLIAACTIPKHPTWGMARAPGRPVFPKGKSRRLVRFDAKCITLSKKLHFRDFAVPDLV